VDCGGISDGINFASHRRDRRIASWELDTMSGVRRAGYQVAVFLAVVVGAWVATDSAIALAPSTTTGHGPEPTIGFASPGIGDVQTLDTSFTPQLPTEDSGARSIGTGGDAGFGPENSRLIHAKLGVAAAVLLLAGTGAIAVLNRAQIRDAFSIR
jgi:hypothetical protein